MTFSPEVILAHELVGLDARILQASDPNLVGISGVIAFETKNTILIRLNNAASSKQKLEAEKDWSGKTRIVVVPKMVAKTIQVTAPDGVCFINGSALIGRPEDRITRGST